MMKKKLDPIPNQSAPVANKMKTQPNKAVIASNANALKASINKNSSMKTLQTTKSTPVLAIVRSNSSKKLTPLASAIQVKENVDNNSSKTLVEPTSSQEGTPLSETTADPSDTPTLMTLPILPSTTAPCDTVNSSLLAYQSQHSLHSPILPVEPQEFENSTNTLSKLSSSQSTPALGLPVKEQEVISVRKGAPNWPAMVSKSNKNTLTVGAAALWMKNRNKKPEEPEQVEEKIIAPVVLEEEDDIPTIKFAKKKTTLVRQCEKCQMLYGNFHSC